MILKLCLLFDYCHSLSPHIIQIVIFIPLSMHVAIRLPRKKRKIYVGYSDRRKGMNSGICVARKRGGEEERRESMQTN